MGSMEMCCEIVVVCSKILILRWDFLNRRPPLRTSLSSKLYSSFMSFGGVGKAFEVCTFVVDNGIDLCVNVNFSKGFRILRVGLLWMIWGREINSRGSLEMLIKRAGGGERMSNG